MGTHQETALHASARQGSSTICRSLCLFDAFNMQNQSDVRGFTALHVGARKGHADVVEELLVQPKFSAVGAKTACGHTAVCEVLLAHAGYLVDDQDSQGMTALHFAAERDDVANCKLLLEARANANLLEIHGFNPFHLATANGNLKVVEALVSSWQFSDLASGRRALDLAVQSGNAEVCEHTFALKDTRGLHQRGPYGWSLLHVAAELGHADVCSVLIRRGGARLANALNEQGETALHIAAQRGHTETCEAICSAKEFLAIDAKSVSGRTAVNLALLQRHKRTAAVISSHICPPWHSH